MSPLDGLIIILGAPNDEQGNLSQMALERLAKGLILYRQNPGCKILLTGGFGDHFNRTGLPHAHYAQQALLAQGVPESDFVEVALSRHTVEDGLLSRPLAARYGAKRLIVVTSDFHLRRAKFIFDRLFPGYDLSYAAAPSQAEPEELDRLRQHEAQALDQLETNWDSDFGSKEAE